MHYWSLIFTLGCAWWHDVTHCYPIVLCFRRISIWIFPFSPNSRPHAPSPLSLHCIVSYLCICNLYLQFCIRICVFVFLYLCISIWIFPFFQILARMPRSLHCAPQSNRLKGNLRFYSLINLFAVNVDIVKHERG